MPKSPIKWNKTAVGKVGEYATAGTIMGMLPGFTEPGTAILGAGIGAAIGAGAGVAAAYRAKKHRALGRQFKD